MCFGQKCFYVFIFDMFDEHCLYVCQRARFESNSRFFNISMKSIFKNRYFHQKTRQYIRNSPYPFPATTTNSKPAE